MSKPTRHVTYQFPEYFVTFERATEQGRIDEVEAAGDYIDKFEVTNAERANIDTDGTQLEVVDSELIITPDENVIQNTEEAEVV